MKGCMHEPYEAPGPTAPEAGQKVGRSNIFIAQLLCLLRHNAWLKPVGLCGSMGMGQGGKVPLVHALPPPSLLPSCTKVGLHPDSIFCSEKDPYCLGGRQNASIPHRLVIPRSNRTEINSTPPASPCTAEQVFQSPIPLQWIHLKSITSPLLPVIDEQLKCA